MKSLLRFEFFKMRKRKSLYICTAVMLSIIFLALLASYEMMQEWDIGYVPSAITYVLSATGTCDFAMIAGIFVALYVCEDFGQRTVKNVYSRGFSRVGVYFSKLIICALYVVAAFLLVELFTLAFGSLLFEYRVEEGHILALLLGQLLVCLAYASFAFAVGFMVKKTGIAIAISIVAPIAVSFVLALLDVYIDSETFFLSDYWLEGISNSLSNPLTEVKDIVVGCILPVIYSALFVTAGFFVHRKAEV